jgi:hypothetical protein
MAREFSTMEGLGTTRRARSAQSFKVLASARDEQAKETALVLDHLTRNQQETRVNA